MGDNEPIHTDVRVLCATNRDLWGMSQRDEFREDLLLPREHVRDSSAAAARAAHDIPELALSLLARAARRPAEHVQALMSHSVIEALGNYEWPGNVRELANAMDYAWIVSGGPSIRRDIFRHRSELAAPAGDPTSPRPRFRPRLPHRPPRFICRRVVGDVEMAHIFRVLEKHNGHKASAAEELGISLKTLYNKLNRIRGIAPPGGVSRFLDRL